MARRPSGSRQRGDRSFRERAYESARRAIQRSMGIDLHDLKTPIVPGFAPPIVERIASLPALSLRILLLSNATMKFQEQVLLSFFGRLSTTATDVLTVSGMDRSIRPQLLLARYVDEAEASRTEYDVVVGFDCGVRLLEEVRRREVPGVLIGIPRTAGDPAGSLRPLLRHPLRGYTTQWWSTSMECGFALGVGNVDVRSRILYPPNVPLNRETPAHPAFDILVPGGGDRDYELLRRIVDEIGAERVLVTAASGGGPHLHDPRNEAIEQLGGDDRFVLIDWIPAYRYVDIVANARVVVLPLIGVARGDLTCISDALWYGRPVLATRTAATEHLEGVVTFFEDPSDVARALARLDEAEEYEAVSARSRAHAREHHDFYKLLFDVFDGLRELEDSPERETPRPLVPEGWIGASSEQVLALMANRRFRDKRVETTQTRTKEGIRVRRWPQTEGMFIRIESGPGACRLTVEAWPMGRSGERQSLERWWSDIWSELRERAGAPADWPDGTLDASETRY